MSIDNYLLYVLIAVGYIASPGPAVLVAINGGVAVGVKRTAALLAGNTVGLGALAFISALGVGALILNSAKLTVAVKILGALWLVYLGVKTMRSPAAPDPGLHQDRLRKIYAGAGGLAEFRDGLVLALTNPKPIVFFVSIYPQFIVADGSIARRFLLLGATFMLLSFGILNVYSALSAVIAEHFLDAKKIRLVNYLFGGTFLALALFLLAETYG
ncbi:MAG: LysE family translocator [Gammaproteobacteria bacterium]|nr:LysE family translocator [Gammaproteobacteria bacterium]MDD9874095.1 LysE family translocator [Gammaproteobacteria bacterium]